MMDRYRLNFMAQSVNSSYWPVDDLVVGLEDVRVFGTGKSQFES